MKKYVKNKVTLTILCIILGLCSALGVNAAKDGYTTYEGVIKNSSAIAYSGSTGSNTFSFQYSANCNIGKIDVCPQVLMDLSYENLEGPALVRNLEAGQTTGVLGMTIPPYKLARLKLANTGQGTGYIQGQGNG